MNQAYLAFVSHKVVGIVGIVGLSLESRDRIRDDSEEELIGATLPNVFVLGRGCIKPA